MKIIPTILTKYNAIMNESIFTFMPPNDRLTTRMFTVITMSWLYHTYFQVEFVITQSAVFPNKDALLKLNFEVIPKQIYFKSFLFKRVWMISKHILRI